MKIMHTAHKYHTAHKHTDHSHTNTNTNTNTWEQVKFERAALYWVLWVIMAYVPEDYQPIMAVVIPLFREGLVEILQMTGVFLCRSVSSWF